MKKILITLTLLMSGCVGVWNGNPYGKQESETLGIVSDNEEVIAAIRFRSQQKMNYNFDRNEQIKTDEDNPWANYDYPPLFPYGWKHGRKLH